MKTKIIANYLPQFHTIPENDMWWGKGFTDWIAVKKAEPLFPGHDEPRIPIDNNYYDLSKKEAIAKQAEMATKYGVYGFGIYHYWFSQEMHLLHKPAEIILNNSDIDIHYMFIWDNGSWKRTWSNVKDFANDWAPVLDETKKRGSDENGLLAELHYGEEREWKAHFNYLLPFFKDDRYIKMDGKPLFAIFHQGNNSEVLRQMIQCWHRLAQEAGLPGIMILGKHNSENISITDYEYFYEPLWHGWVWHNYWERIRNKVEDVWHKKRNTPTLYRYDSIWNQILTTAIHSKDKKLFYGGFVGYDDSPRRGKRGKIIRGASPEKFECYLGKLLEISSDQGKEFIFLTAWNEWGEGAYLEPDKTNGYAYLSAVKKALERIRLQQ